MESGLVEKKSYLLNNAAILQTEGEQAKQTKTCELHFRNLSVIFPRNFKSSTTSLN